MFDSIAKTQPVAIAALMVVIAFSAIAQTPPRSPSDTVREFYRIMREGKFREAFALSIYKPAIDPLTPAEFEDLQPDFQRMAAAIPEKLQLTGEQISGDSATVFVKVKEVDATTEKAEPMSLIRVNGVWIVGDRENEAIVKKAGRDFFFNARIDTHHSEVQSLFQRITLAQVVYGQQHNGQYGNLAELITSGLLPKDLEGTESTGYRFQVNKSADGKTWYATAEPAQYGKTGRLSFYLDASGVRSGDVGGKPLVPKN
jgi:hypothetical protein